MADDLNQPLLGANKRRGALTPGGIALTVLAVIMAGFAIWMILVSDPSAVSDAEPAEVAGAVGPGEVVIRTPDTNVPGVVITTPAGIPIGDNGPEIITLIGEPLTLSPAPLSDLVEPGPYGLLPKTADDGWRPFDAYARPAQGFGTVRIAIVVGGIGINAAGSEMAIARLPGEVSLALAPYGADLSGWAARGREAGHELLLQLPLEPIDFPNSDPGPHTLLADGSPAENIDRLHWLLAQFTTYAGVITYAGGRFLSDREAMAPMLDELAARGLMLVDDGSVRQSSSGDAAAGILPFARADMVLDFDVSAEAVAAKLAELEAMARLRGFAIASASAFPVTIQQIALWAETAVRDGIELVPVTALANDPVMDAVRIQID